MASAGIEVRLHSFLTTTLDGGDWSAELGSWFNSARTAHGTRSIGGIFGLRDQYGHSEVEKHFVYMLEIDPRYLGRPTRSLVPIPIELPFPAIANSHNAQIVI